MFNFRLPREKHAEIREMARVYGATGSGFVRELVLAAISGPEQAQEFVARLLRKQGEQLALDWSAKVPAKGVGKANKPRKKGRGRHGPP